MISIETVGNFTSLPATLHAIRTKLTLVHNRLSIGWGSVCGGQSPGKGLGPVPSRDS